MGGHAKLSPSAAKRWLTCPGSVEATARTVSPDNEHSLAGTAGHEAHEIWLRTGEPPAAGWKAANGVIVTQEMLDLVGQSVGWIRQYLQANRDCAVMTEEQIRIGSVFGVADDVLYGTADTLVLAKHELVVHDLKLGYVDVQAEENPQLMLYAAGALNMLGWLWDHVRLVIAQPKNGGVKEWAIPTTKLQAWINETQPKVHAALAPDAPFVPSEEGCRYCSAAGVCKALQTNALEVAKREFDSPASLVENISVEDLALLLAKADMIEVAMKAAREHALKLIQLGVDVPGWKAVEGRKNRAWKEGVESVVQARLRALGFNEEEFAPRKMVSPAQAEKIAGKNAVEEFVEKPKGAPVLAPATDKRPALPAHFEVIDTGTMLD